MNIKKSCAILEIDITQLTYKRVKQQYYKFALLSHPDKISDSSFNFSDFSFQDINDAYTFLINYLQENNISPPVDPSNNIKNEEIFIFILEHLFHPFAHKFNNYDNIFNLFSNLSSHDISEFKQLLFYIKHLLPDPIYDFLYNKDNENNNLHYLYPDFNDLIQHNILILTYNNSKFYVPSWHKQIYFDNLTVISNPILPSYINIDEFNNIHVYISQHISTILDTSSNYSYTFPFIKSLNDNTLALHIPNKIYHFHISKIHIKKNQIVKLFNKGIPTILNSNIYSNKYIAHLFIHLNLF